MEMAVESRSTWPPESRTLITVVSLASISFAMFRVIELSMFPPLLAI